MSDQEPTPEEIKSALSVHMGKLVLSGVGTVTPAPETT